MSVIRKDPLHWIIVVALIAVGVFLGEWLGSHRRWIRLRYDIYQYVQRFNPKEVYPKRTALVLIGDKEYWTGPLAYRVPVKRDYLANLLRAIDKLEPVAIALDFDLRSRVADGRLSEHPDYVDETQNFLETVRDVSRRRPVVLARTFGFARDRGVVPEVSIYDGFDFQNGDVQSGYIELPYDLRQVPMPLPLRQGDYLDSFAVAIVRPIDKEAVRIARLQSKNALPYGTFIEPRRFDAIAASEVLNAANLGRLRSRLRNKIVVVGASWSRLAYGRGGLIDSDETPVGRVGGVFMHANYVEALLDQRTYKPLSSKTAMWIEIIMASIVAVIVALKIRRGWKSLYVTGIFLLLVLVAYFFWQNLGLFFDFFIPLVLLMGHAVVEQVGEWRKAAHSKD